MSRISLFVLIVQFLFLCFSQHNSNEKTLLDSFRIQRTYLWSLNIQK
jgi:hypothetical protein